MPDAQSSRVRQYVAGQQSLERLEFRPESVSITEGRVK